jgi:hypothetical protein
LNEEKSKLGKDQEEILKELGRASGPTLTKWVNNYRKNIEGYNKLQVREYDDLKKILGNERLAKYLLIKRDFTNKVKNLLSEKNEKKDGELPTPKVIVE